MASAADNFDRADSTGLGANWTAQTGNFNVVGNEARLNGDIGINDANVPYTATPPDSGYYRAAAQIVALTSAVHGLSVRASNAALTYYGLTLDTTTITLFRYVAGAYVELDTLAVATAGFVAGNWLRLTCQGTNPVLLTCEMSTNGTDWTPLDLGTAGTYSDANAARITANNFAGLSGYGIASAEADLDNWSFEDVVVVVAPVLSSGTPSGTLGTQTTATLGATTDQNTGTFYGVVDSSANLIGVSASQIKAGQRADGSAAVASANSTVSTTSPSAGVTGLTAGTAYAYALIQNNANGDSNIVTGTFTTAAAATSSRPPPPPGARVATMMLT
jgi:hypothetical protein